MVEAQSRLNTTLQPSERHRVLIEWNSTETDYPRDRCIHQLIEATVAARPDAVALRFRQQSITYRELNRRANHVAQQLRSFGIAPEAVVGICVERSPEAVMGFLATMKAGAAYLPLNPTLPKERLAFMLCDAGVRVILTQPHVRGCLPAFDGQIVDLVDDLATDPQYDNNSDSGATPSNVAYIIYTSGSTGRQKGVLVEHGGLTNTVWAQIKAWGIQPNSRIVQFLNLSFDAAQAEIYRALVAEATLCIAPPETLPGSPLFEFLRDERINLYTTLPAVLSTLPLDEELPDLHTLTLGGEPCPAELAAHWHRGRKLLVAYGPTEATICATIATEWQSGQPPPIGKPIANTQTYILDEDLSPVAIETPGEIYIGGVCVARGYLNQPALTAERFVPDPYGNKLGARLYRTGDKARWQPDGNIEFLGRFDDQVKVRGYRIEVGEIEATLGQHRNIRHAVVMPFEDIPGDKRLVGYIVAQRAPAPSPRELRQFIAGRLPAYMVPSTFVFLPEMPFTVNGKLNRKALPAPDPARFELDGETVAARNTIEEAIAGVWRQLLRVKEIGVHDNFFELGGNSLLATQAVARIRETLGRDLALRTLFEQPTIAGVALSMEWSKPATGDDPSLCRVDRSSDLPLSFAQHRLWFMDQMEPGNPLYNLHAAMRLRGPLDIPILERCLREIVRRHEVLRTTIGTRDGKAFQTVRPLFDIALKIHDLSHLPAEQRETQALELARTEALKPFDLERGPLIRPTLLRLDEADHFLLPTMHHVVSDAWSLGVFTQELASLYEAFAEGRPSPLPELVVQYADFAAWQRQWLQGDVLEQQLIYWKQRLATLPHALELPTDKPRPAIQRYRGDQLTFALPREMGGALERICLSERITLYMLLLAAYQVLLSRYSRQDDLVVGSPVAGRNRPETEPLIGMFVNILVLRADLSGTPPFREFLKQVRETCLGAFAHQDVPFEKLVDTLQPERDLGRSPVFQAAFVLQNAPPPTLKFIDISISHVDLDHGTSKADISLNITATDQGLVGRFVYNTDLFEPATISRMARDFETLLHGIVADPDTPVKEFLGRVADQINAVPLPKLSQPKPEPIHVPPRTETEATLVRIWAAVLRCETIGIEDNFFSLGGDSISSIQVIARANRAGMRLTAKDLFQHQTIAKLAAACESLAGERAAQHVANAPRELNYWTNALGAEIRRLPVDFDGSRSLTATQTITRVLEFCETKSSSGDVLEIASPKSVDVMLTALLQAVEGWTGQRSLLIDVDIATSKSQDKGDGDTNSYSAPTRAFPLRLDLGDAGTAGEALQLVEERLRAVPNDGHGFAALSQSADETIVRRIQALPAAEIRFCNHDKNDAKTKSYIIEVHAAINNDSLCIDWIYHPDLHRQSTIASVAAAFMDRLRALLDHQRSAEKQHFSAADFPEARLSDDELEALLSQIGTGEEDHLS